MNKLILSLFGLVALAISQALGQICADNSFELKHNQFVPNELNVDIIMTISIRPSVNPGTQTEVEYANSCIDKVRFEISLAGSNIATKEYDFLPVTDLKSVSFKLLGAELKLPTLSEFSVVITYTQKGSNSNQFPGYSETIYTCFGNPSKPKNLNLVINQDGSGTLTWDESEVINAPKLCYYTVFKRNNPGIAQEILRIDDPQPSTTVTVTAQDMKSYEIIVTASNDISCFPQLAFAQTCTSPRDTSDSIQISKITTTLKPPTTTATTIVTTTLRRTTTTSNDSNRPSISLLTLFLFFLLAFIN